MKNFDTYQPKAIDDKKQSSPWDILSSKNLNYQDWEQTTNKRNLDDISHVTGGEVHEQIYDKQLHNNQPTPKSPESPTVELIDFPLDYDLQQALINNPTKLDNLNNTKVSSIPPTENIKTANDRADDLLKMLEAAIEKYKR